RSFCQMLFILLLSRQPVLYFCRIASLVKTIQVIVISDLIGKRADQFNWGAGRTVSRSGRSNSWISRKVIDLVRLAEVAAVASRQGCAALSEWGDRTLENFTRSEEHTSELQSRENLVCRLLLEKKKKQHPKLLGRVQA